VFIRDIGSGLYLINDFLVIGTFQGQYVHSSAVSISNEIVTFLTQTKGLQQFSINIGYEYRGRILLRGFISSTNYAFIEGKDAWGENWVRRKAGGDWIDF
jgi:hypothetical protein